MADLKDKLATVETAKIDEFLQTGKIDATMTIGVEHVTPEAAKSRLAVERARSVEPVHAAGLWSLVLIVALLGFAAFVLVYGGAHWPKEVVIAALVLIGLIGAPLALGLSKLMKLFGGDKE